MDGGMGALVVQISNPDAHHVSTGRSGLIGLVVFVFGLCLIGYGLWRTVRQFGWRSRARVSAACVQDVIVGKSLWRREIYTPVVEFRAGDRLLRVAIGAAARRDRWPIGLVVEVLWDPAHPHRICLRSSTIFISGWLLTGLSVTGCYLALVT